MLPREKRGAIGLLSTCLLLLISGTHQHGSGAPPGACVDQTPRHSTIQPQSSVPPYVITTSSSQVRQGDTINVTIASAVGLPTPIGGFILQARLVQKPETIVGQFIRVPDTELEQIISCRGDNDSVTHTTPDDKPSLTFTWMAPNDLLGGIEFRATVAQSYATFWRNVESTVVEVVTPDTVIPEPKIVQPDEIYQGCTDKKLCFGSPRNCIENGDCQAIVTVQPSGNTYTFEIQGSGNPKYIAAALSMDPVMGEDSAMECVRNNEGNVDLFTSWTYPKSDPYVNRTESPQDIVKMMSSSVKDGKVYCKFQRNTVTNVMGKTFDLASGRYNLMIVSGEDMKDANRVGFHSLVYESTRDPLALSSVGDARKLLTPPTIMETKQKAAPTQLDTIYQGCDSSKLCFGTPQNCLERGDCKAVVAIFVAGDSYTFEIQGTGSPKYVAAALSMDKNMGDDSAMECVSDDRGRIRLFTSWTYPKVEPYVNRKESPQDIVQLEETSMVDGKLYCKFKRDTVSVVKGVTFDLASNTYNLMVVAGDSMKDPDRVGFHTLAYESTADALALASVGAAAGASKLLLRLHGCFMLAAWLGTSVIGIVLARYFKQTWVGKQLGGKDIWFAYHRILMVLTWLLTVAAFVIILVEVGGFQTTGDNPHAITGLITVILAFLQPIGAYFRPHPGTKARPVFNWLHWLGGNAAHILGIATIFLAVYLQKAELPSWSVYILAAYVAFHVAMHLVLSLTVCVSDGRISSISNGRVNSFPMKDMMGGVRQGTQVDRSVDAPYSSFRRLLLTIYCAIVVLFTVAMICLVALAPISQTYTTIMGN